MSSMTPSQLSDIKRELRKYPYNESLREAYNGGLKEAKKQEKSGDSRALVELAAEEAAVGDGAAGEVMNDIIN